MNEMLEIQMELKSPKSKYNKFGGFSYRCCEDILEAAKPVLAKHNALLLLTDDVILIGEMVFMKSTATLRLSDESTFVTTGFARIDKEKKGMDAAQVTGSASSYARKYALGALFLIDNEQDPDAQPPQNQPTPAPTPAPTALPLPGTFVYPAATPGVRPPPPPPPPPPPANR